MAADLITKFLEALGKEPKAKEALEKASMAGTEQEKLDIILLLAKEMGYNLTGDELKAYIEEKQEAQKERTDSLAETIEKIDDAEMTKVAGGAKDHEECRDTYRDAENCTYNDGCDVIFQGYPDYQCFATQQICNNNMLEKICNVINLL